MADAENGIECTNVTNCMKLVKFEMLKNMSNINNSTKLVPYETKTTPTTGKFQRNSQI